MAEITVVMTPKHLTKRKARYETEPDDPNAFGIEDIYLPYALVGKPPVPQIEVVVRFTDDG